MKKIILLLIFLPLLSYSQIGGGIQIEPSEYPKACIDSFGNVVIEFGGNYPDLTVLYSELDYCEDSASAQIHEAWKNNDIAPILDTSTVFYYDEINTTSMHLDSSVVVDGKEYVLVERQELLDINQTRVKSLESAKGMLFGLIAFLFIILIVVVASTSAYFLVTQKDLKEALKTNT